VHRSGQRQHSVIEGWKVSRENVARGPTFAGNRTVQQCPGRSPIGLLRGGAGGLSLSVQAWMWAAFRPTSPAG